MTDDEIAKLRALCEAARLEEDTEEKSGEDFDTIARVAWSDAAEAALPAALDEIERLRAENETLEGVAMVADISLAENDGLRALLKEALDEIEQAWPYAGEYFEEKWRDRELEARIRTALGLAQQQEGATDA